MNGGRLVIGTRGDKGSMGKLKTDQVDEYFTVHLPYRTRIMLAHYKMTHDSAGNDLSWTTQRGPVSWLQACFEASLSGR
jgi:hypothetical protein